LFTTFDPVRNTPLKEKNKDMKKYCSSAGARDFNKAENLENTAF
jgi:hypothetical protein